MTTVIYVNQEERWIFDRLFATLQDIELNTAHRTLVAKRMVRLAKELSCPKCGGKGWYTSAEHDCGGDIYKCFNSCPIQVQVECDCGINDGE